MSLAAVSSAILLMSDAMSLVLSSAVIDSPLMVMVVISAFPWLFRSHVTSVLAVLSPAAFSSARSGVPAAFFVSVVVIVVIILCLSF